MTESSTMDRIVEWTQLRLGKKLVIGTPLGLGKPNALLNAFYRRARQDPSVDLQIVTALSLDVPQGGSELERRFVKPFADRHFGEDYPRLEFAVDEAAGRLPPNVRVCEFYFQSGARLGNAHAQRNYISSNYTHVARDFVSRGANLILQLVAEGQIDGQPKLSLSSNPDVTLELKARLKRVSNHRCLFIAQIHPDLPFMHGDAVVDRDFFDCIVEPPARHKLFAVPRGTVSTRDYWVGCHASALIADGGSLQIGIGSLSDALVYALGLRQQENDTYRSLLEAGGTERAAALIDAVGGRDPFEAGLFGASEMFMDGFMHLYEMGILKRRAFDDQVMQDLADDGKLPEVPDRDLVEALWEGGSLPRHLDAGGLARFKALGVLAPEVRIEDGLLAAPGRKPVENDLSVARNRNRMAASLLARRVGPGMLMEAAFFLGSQAFYDWLNNLDASHRPRFVMSSVARINQLYGGREQLEIRQRREARFVNTTMKMTLTGAAVSDGLEDYQMVSGVGGQYNFVAMAHALRRGRSLLLLRSVRETPARTTSNVVWDYPYTTIPRHLRDIVVTEYGIADLRGRTDEECIKAMIAISDRQFQDQLAARAKAAGKLRSDYVIPDHARSNTLEHLERLLDRERSQGRFPRFPFGSDFDETEQRLIAALLKLKSISGSKLKLARAILTGDPEFDPGASARMGLSSPAGVKERIMRRLLGWALRGAAGEHQ